MTNGKTEWTTLSGRFTDEEMKVIKQIQGNLNDNQFIRASVNFIVKLGIVATMLSADSPITKAVEPLVKEVFNEQVVKDMEKKVGEAEAKISPEVIQQGKEYAENLKEYSKPFEEHKKRGKPKQHPKKRGRPKDTGAENK